MCEPTREPPWPEASDEFRKRNAEGYPWREAHWYWNLLSVVEEMERYQDRSLEAFKIQRREEGWLVVITAFYKGRKLVAFCGGEDFHDTLGRAIHQLFQKRLKWRDSKY